jgi:ERCC4-related helicase
MMIKNFKPRLYQETILATAVEKNTLVVLPTGLGKTYIFLMLAAHQLKKYPDTKILLLGPTRPLISQYYNLFLRHFNIQKEEMAVFTGQVGPSKREEQWKNSRIIFSTPQGMENDVISNRVSMKEVSLLGFDEAHRAVGDYSYVWIAKQYMKESRNPRIIALTASPGSDLEKITEVCKNLYIEDVEIRTDEDPDVKPYIKEVDIKWNYVELPPEFKRIRTYLDNCFDSKISMLREYSPELVRLVETKRDILAIQSGLLKEISSGNNSIEIMKSLSLVAEAIKVQHALELLESQGITPLLEYMEDLNNKAAVTKVKAVKNLVMDLNFKSALILTRNLKEHNTEHPKYEVLRKIILENRDKKIIIFSQYRDSITNIVSEISKLGLEARMFVGQAKKKGTGLTQKEQLALIKEFEQGKFNILVMSSVGEEGLDLPSVDIVIFYEPVPSAIRSIQRRGRTGRHERGQVYVLVTKDTRDEGYKWSSFHKEKRMQHILKELKKKFTPVKTEKKLSDFVVPDQGITIYADYREKGSGIIKKLIDLGVNIRLGSLEVGDYLLSSDVVIEHKTVEDFVDSLIDRRLFTQIKDMKKYPKQVIIIEGDNDLFSQRKLHPNAVRGMLAVICVDYAIPLLTAKDSNEVALLLAVIAKRLQSTEKKDFTLHSQKPLTLREQQEYLVSALPGIGPILSKPLLKHFGSVKNIMNAEAEKLMEVELIGNKKADKIKEVIDSEYKD